MYSQWRDDDSDLRCERGRPVATTAPEAFSGELEIIRGDLVEILYAATRADVEYLLDGSIASLERDEDGVQVDLKEYEALPPQPAAPHR